ncbi:AAA family ATPase [Paucibacter sp. O1-1]|nr:AAA family ATPase [Paucibacter sp. O1-1]MDA3826577.1 AAA family ATPase [Paucibacter sp. O1-1]
MNSPFLKKSKTTVYTEHDLQQSAAIKKWLADREMTRAWLSRKTRIPSGTVSQILSGKYVSSPTRQLQDMLAALKVEEERASEGTSGYFKGSVHGLMEVVCDRTRLHQSFGVITGFVGIGKTRFCKEYRVTHPQTILVEASPNMTPGVLLCELLGQLNTPAPAGLDRKFREVVRVLRGTNYLIIVDEAEKCSGIALDYLRRIRDMGLVGVVLTGTEKLRNLIQPEHGQFDQIRSRVSMWPKTIERITRDDADEMAREALSDAGDLSDEVLDTIWAYSAGSARVLNESLVPAIRDYGMDKLPLSAKLIEAIAAKVLFMAKPRTDGSKA